MNITSKITLDLSRRAFQETIYAKQGDDNTRFVQITLTDNGAVYKPPSGASASLRCRKPDGNGIYNTAAINSDGTVTVELTQQVLAVPGPVLADVSLAGSGGEILSTVSFVIRVEVMPGGNNVTSESEYLELLRLIEAANGGGTGGGGGTSEPTTVDLSTVANLHVWRRVGSSGGSEDSGGSPGTEIVLGAAQELELSYWEASGTVATNPNESVTYADEITVTDGALALVDGTSLTVGSGTDCSLLLGKYIKSGGAYYYIPTDAEFTKEDLSEGSITKGRVSVDKAQPVSVGSGTAAETTGGYICAEDRTAYPDTGDYEYLGQIGDAFEGGGEGLPMPETAQPGQIIQISAVDSDGKVVATEAVDMPSGQSDILSSEGVAF